MKCSFRLLLSVMLCLMLTSGALAQGLELTDPLVGEIRYPVSTTEENMGYVFRYSFPQFTTVSQVDQAINAYYQAIAQDMQSEMTISQNAEIAAEMGEMHVLYELDYQVMLNDERYVSVIESSRLMAGNTESDSISATTFARDGLYAGQPITFSQVLGLEEEGDELTSTQSIAQGLAYKLVWDIVKRDSENIESEYLDGLSEEVLHQAFDPETDFYIDHDGNIVFFIQAGTIAGSIAGILTFPFATAELLSAVKD